MKRGLVIGKFLPLHAGHIALIRFAASQCDELIVSMSYTMQDPIDSSLRFSWIVDTFRDLPKVKPEMVPDDFDDESLPLSGRMKIWAKFVKQRFPEIAVVFSSESYGEGFAAALGAQHISFDQERKQFPVAGSLIRQRPAQYWDFIPVVARPYFVSKVCFYGPESTGKSTMARSLAAKYHTVWVPEVSRELVFTNAFTVEDIIHIGYAQNARVNEKLKEANRILICDTDLITTQIYSEYYLHTVPPVLYELERQINYNQYFLFDIDVEWVSDGLRDLSHNREEMFSRFRSELEKRNLPYVLVRGNYETRERIICQELDRLLL